MQSNLVPLLISICCNDLPSYDHLIIESNYLQIALLFLSYVFNISISIMKNHIGVDKRDYIELTEHLFDIF